ncbi:putative bifunctional diguanylate cyclase/phosphodiesterase [Pseudomonas sp. GCM10022188]|uniref:putative bifunctional diguanylate cyclase/phosphodiesterase n=1 Tax=Pseudomonas TaxID=286 RepID=UPI001E3D68A1|nr:GGDEF domain-containing phosphodiesterase [Pseudomonas oryzagri]MCC6074618.1 EAL domain-containing protein [Pseudomonas oryzagri]
MPPDLKKSLSYRLSGQLLLAALALGLLLAAGQIAVERQQIRQAIHDDGERLLALFEAAVTHAVSRHRRDLADDVAMHLLNHPGVLLARVRDGHAIVLAERTRAETPGHPLLGANQRFTLRLSDPALPHEPTGDLELILGSAYRSGEFLASASLSLASHLAGALLLGLTLLLLGQRLLTRPLTQLLEHLARIEPERAGEQQLPRLKGHEQDEIGRWVERTNQLLAAIARQQSQRREAENTLQRMSQFDQLTGLPNRQLLQRQLERLLHEASRRQERLAVVCLGLDGFTALNERYGYQIGDRLLVSVADRLRHLDSQLGSLARLGGDQFALVQIAFEHSYQAADLAQQVLDALAQPLQIEQHAIGLPATAGIALFPDDGDSGERLLQRAEQTMSLAKQGARQRYQFFIASLDREIRRRRQLEQDLRQAVHNEQLELYYQPQVESPGHVCVGVEALLRWRHPQLGFVPPDQFIPLAEQNELILEIGDWVLERACRQLRDWHQQGLAGLRMAVNLSTSQLRSDRLPRQVAGLLQRYGLPAYSLELEVTETGLMTDVAGAAQQLHSLRRSKVLLAIDDFGTGYSSLNYLKTLPLHKIKIDRSFIRELPHNEDDATIVRTIIQLAHNLNMQVLAEGVESVEQEAYLLAHGCRESQGYLHCRPLPAFEVTQYLLTATRRQPTSLTQPI